MVASCTSHHLLFPSILKNVRTKQTYLNEKKMKYIITLTIESEVEDMSEILDFCNEEVANMIPDYLEGALVDASVEHYLCPIATAYLELKKYMDAQKERESDDTPDPEIMAKCFKEDNDI